MKQDIEFKHLFVESLPEVLKERTLYVCMEFATASHKCACGCGKEVVTPLSPIDWKLGYDGRTVTLHPSIGNWGFECRSHYWIRSNRVEWAASWSAEEIKAGRSYDKYAKNKYFDALTKAQKPFPPSREAPQPPTPVTELGLWQKIVQWWQG